MSEHEFHKISIEQCDATAKIRERFRSDDAIRYWIGEKLLNFLEQSDRRPEFAHEIPKFAAEVRRGFQSHEIADFLDRLAHERSAEEDEDWPLDDFEDAELEPRDVVNEAAKIVLIEGEGSAEVTSSPAHTPAGRFPRNTPEAPSISGRPFRPGYKESPSESKDRHIALWSGGRYSVRVLRNCSKRLPGCRSWCNMMHGRSPKRGTSDGRSLD